MFVLAKNLVELHGGRIHAGLQARSFEDLAQQESVNARHLGQLLGLAYLAPDLTDAILNGTQPPLLMLTNIRYKEIQLDWRAQRALFWEFQG